MIYGQIKVNSAYKRYERIPNSRGITGAMVAREILDRNGLSDIQIHVVNGKLSDHYNPRNKTINLSREIHDGTSIAALAVASHECGHAIQHLVGYKPLVFRNAIMQCWTIFGMDCCIYWFDHGKYKCCLDRSIFNGRNLVISNCYFASRI